MGLVRILFAWIICYRYFIPDGIEKNQTSKHTMEQFRSYTIAFLYLLKLFLKQNFDYHSIHLVESIIQLNEH